MADISLFNRSLEALRLLGVADGDIRERFQAAYQQWVPILPGDLRTGDGPRLEALREKLNCTEDGTHGLDDEQVQEAAEEFAGLCEGAIVANRHWQ
jgi:hypothetical protein